MQNLESKLTHKIAEWLINNRHEMSTLDYKEKLPNSDGAWMEIAKDAYGMANFGGGDIVFGVKDASFEPIGINPYSYIDSQTWLTKLSKWVDKPLDLDYLEHNITINHQVLKFSILRIRGAINSPYIPKCDGNYKGGSGKKKTAFNAGKTYTREGTSTVAANGDQLTEIFWKISLYTIPRTKNTTMPMSFRTSLKNKMMPDSHPELLWANMFPAIEAPDHIYLATTKFRKRSEIFKFIHDSIPEKIYIPVFILSDKHIYSFVPFDKNNPLISCIDDPKPTIKLSDWLCDEQFHHNLTMLLNFTLKDHCWRTLFKHDRKNRYYVKRDNRGNSIKWKPHKKMSSRQLVYDRLDASENLNHCIHFAAKMNFVISGQNIFLIIDPTRVITDGINPLDHKYSVRIKTKNNVQYHNNNYLYDLKLALHIIANDKHELAIGPIDNKIIISLKPITGNLNFGIKSDNMTDATFLDELKSEPFDYEISEKIDYDDNTIGSDLNEQ